MWFKILMKSNGLDMVRLAFQRSNFSIYYYLYLFLSSSLLAPSAKCAIFFVRQRFYYSSSFLSEILITAKTRIHNYWYSFQWFFLSYFSFNIILLLIYKSFCESLVIFGFSEFIYVMFKPPIFCHFSNIKFWYKALYPKEVFHL